MIKIEPNESPDSLSGQNLTDRKSKPPILDIGEYQQFTLPSTTITATANLTRETPPQILGLELPLLH